MSHSLTFDNSDFMDTLESSYEISADFQPLESVFRISTPNTLSSAQYSQQPYLDHSYAKLMPSNSFETQVITTGSDSLEPLTSFIDIEDVSCNTTVVTAPMDHGVTDDSNEDDPWEGSVTRCICGFQHDDGYMICCDRCGVWQHVDCMAVDRNNIPESYLCELCHPRLINRRRAIRIQTLKKEQMESELSETDSSGDEQQQQQVAKGQGRKKRETTIRKHLDGHRSQQPVGQNKSVRKRMDSEPNDEKMNNKKTRQMINHKPSGSRGSLRQSTSESSPRLKRNSAFEAKHHITIDHSVEDVCQNAYTDGVLLLLASVRGDTSVEKVSSSTSINPSLLKEQISKQRFRLSQFGSNAKGIEATDTIRVNQAVAEYTGRVMTSSEYEADNQFDVYVPFVLRYAGANGLSVCIDSTISGNDVRYVRCSCMPNAKVVHVIEQNTIRFYICATKNIAEGREVTIPFSYDYQKCQSEVQCACGRASCPVARFFKLKSSSRPVRVRKNAAFLASEDKMRMASEASDNGKRATMPSADKQRRPMANSDFLRGQAVSSDVGADITLMNALTAISTSSSFASSSSSSFCTVGRSGFSSASMSNNGHAAATIRTNVSAKETSKNDRGKKVTGRGGNRSKTQMPQAGLEPATAATSATNGNRVTTIRSHRLRDKMQQISLPSRYPKDQV